MRHLDIIISGFGGQGILSAGRLLAYAGMLESKHVSWLPSYGPEMRGGTANCHVIISDNTIGSPVLTSANALIVMNEPSLDKFERAVVEDGIIISDSSIVTRTTDREDVRFFEIPATKIALEMNNKTYANVVLIGKLLEETKIVSKENIEKAMYKILPSKKHYMIPEEMDAFDKGAEFK